MSKIPAVTTINGEGKPRVILDLDQDIYNSKGTTTYTATSVSEADGSTVAISSVSYGAGQAFVINTGAVHGLALGDFIEIFGNTGSVPDINGVYEVQKIVDTDTIHIDLQVTSATNTGSIKRVPAYDQRPIEVDQYITALMTDSGIDEVVYAKVTEVLPSVISVDEWVGGTPTNGKVFAIAGWVADLPFCQRLVETFTPDNETHEIYRSRVDNELFGYKYQAVLDYAKFVTGDTLLSLKHHLDSAQDGQILLIPRVDTPEFNYPVFIADPISLEIFFTGSTGRGHKGFTLVFRGNEPVTEFAMLDGYGINYGDNYGVNL